MTKMTITKDISQDQLLKRLTMVHEQLVTFNDLINAEKIKQLIEKASTQELNIAFCGHFSAGKSTMINTLFAEDLLPSSPIPTSANVVKVKSGKPYARIHFRDSEPVQFSYPYDINKVKKYCLDGDEVKSVEISHPTTNFPEGVAVLDTPGVDSTDDAHRIATEASLHLADVIFYVMDYNHVQAESNFQFTKMLQSYNKPLYLIINQVDKHNDDELSFDAFKESVVEGFSNWNVKPAGVYFTSLYEQENKYNQYNEVKTTLYNYIEKKKTIISNSIYDTTSFLIEDFHKNQKHLKQEEMNELLSLMDNEPIDELHSKEKKYIKELALIQEAVADIDHSFKDLLASILKDAILMPFKTRELAEQFLEANQPNFKVGLLFAKSKTEQEKEKRLLALHENVCEQISSSLEWVVKEQMISFTKKHNVYDESFKEAVFDAKFTFTKEKLVELVKKGATLNRQYILTYTNDVANEIKKEYRKYAMELFQPLIKQVAQSNKVVEDEIVNKLTIVKNKIDAYEKLTSIKTTIENKTKSLKGCLEEIAAEDCQILTVSHHFKQMSTDQIVFDRGGQNQNKNKDKVDRVVVDHQIDLQQRSKQLLEISNLIKTIPGLQTVERQTRTRAARLASNRYTIALFGAFSAGKSSFANALIGEKVLPVSPNPTTATINKILPIDEKHEHGTILVHMKEEAEILADIQHSLKVFNKEADSFKQALTVIRDIPVNDIVENAKAHYSFLKAFAKGYESASTKFGQIVKVDRKQYEEYVALEHKACFVNNIELYYDCELTRQGVILVDTPGADSINARHTDVAFDYIKNADAVLFVTYFNHAFNHADREFLIQLGRVKDAFELDKMFFIINAKDLAQNDEELQLVMDHVEDNLTECGIRKPRLYPVSSKNALVADNSNDSGMSNFKGDFLPFISQELAFNVDKAAVRQIESIKNVLSDYISTALGEKEEKELQKEQLLSSINYVKESIINRSLHSSNQALKKEIEELLFYVKKRVLFRYNEGFKHAFNPSSLQEDGRNIKVALNKCLLELIEFLSHDWGQELRATTLRIENYINQQLNTIVSLDEKECKSSSISISFTEIEDSDIHSPKISSELKMLDLNKLKKSLTIFKSGKQFFEQDGSVKMKENLEGQLDETMDKELNQTLNQFIKHYIRQQELKRQHTVNAMLELLEDYKVGKMAAFDTSFNVNEVKEIYSKIDSQNRN
ncbi:hypothetical protein CIB95_08440 [Lottiidibacillus patelloidae]|uniref:Dynamin N-terminal domain-containing protein n=1 Tax=Lottiidibacillus patelloidae TaxID=2670334 RepID=A0A263BV90_9BACI|nr:dynamin family protein [Lottiidibacillus patelloidae]OZM57472.1 hypothetical protein CIB95_08440 [Lottiidibacillus patelloidae]